jgi:hypothetical protein
MMDDFRYHFKRGLPFIITILLLMFLPALMFLRKNGFVFFENKGRIKELLWARQDSIHVGDSLKKIRIESKVVGKIQQDSLAKSEKEENPISARDIKYAFYIIAGSFTNTENAKLAAGKYRSLGYKTSIISLTDRNGIKAELVSVKAFSNLKEAEEYLKKFKKKSDPEAWIYTKK